jgi:hypothetical protein
LLEDESLLQKNFFNDLIAKVKREMMPCNHFLKLSGDFFSEGTYSGGGNLYATFKRIEKKFVKKTQVVVKLKFKCKGLFSGNTSVKNGRLSLLVHTRVYKKKNK